MEENLPQSMQQESKETAICVPAALRNLLRSPLPYVALFLILANIGAKVWQNDLARQRQQNLLLQPQMADSHSPPRWDRSVGEQLGKYLPRMPDAARTPLALVVGMSQMYAINEAKPEDKIITEHLDDLLSKHGVRAFGLAAPNMHNEEALLLLFAALGKPKTVPRFFVYGVCFDKFRNIDLRPSFQKYLREDPALMSAWEAAAKEYSQKYPRASEKMLASLRAAVAQGEKREDTFESRLRARAAAYIPLLAARQELNGAVLMQLFTLRNWVFNIKPQTKRPLIQSRYDLNREFLGMLADISRGGGVEPVFYIVPLNPLAENPYIPEEYAAFKEWLPKLCAERNIPFANFESVVPSSQWGEFMGGPDFKHFKEEGHRLTAEAIYRNFKSVFLAKKPK